MLREALRIRDEEVAASISIVEYGADLVAELAEVRAMTICNTGGLATVERLRSACRKACGAAHLQHQRFGDGGAGHRPGGHRRPVRAGPAGGGPGDGNPAPVAGGAAYRLGTGPDGPTACWRTRRGRSCQRGAGREICKTIYGCGRRKRSNSPVLRSLRPACLVYP